MRGARLLALARVWFDERTVTLIFEPLVADWQRELHEARARGVTARSIAMFNGLVALTMTAMICANPFRPRDGAPMWRFSSGLILFAVVALALQAQPLQYAWRHWDWHNPQVFWRPSLEVLWSTPRFLAYGVVLAMLPAALLAAEQRTQMRRLIAGFAVAIVAVVSLNAWVVPAADRVQGVRFWTLAGIDRVTAEQRAAASEAHLNAFLTDNHPTPARIVWARTRDIAPMLLLGVAFGVIGAALGRARAVRGERFSTIAVFGWWIFGWTAYLLLRYWSGQLRVVLLLPMTVAIWLPPLVFLMIAVLAALRTGGTLRLEHVRRRPEQHLC